MDRKRVIDIIGTVLLFAGFFLAFLPHAAHISVGLQEDHLQHVIKGSVLVFFSLGGLIYNNNALNKKKVKFLRNFKLLLK